MVVRREEETLPAAMTSGSRQRIRLKKSRSPSEGDGRKVGDGEVRRPQMFGTEREMRAVLSLVIVAGESMPDVVDAENLLAANCSSIGCCC